MIGNILNKTIYIVVSLAVVIAGAYITYNWQHSKVNTLNSKINQLNSQVSGLNTQIVDLTNQLKNSCQTSNNAVDNIINCAGYSYTSLKGVKILVFTPAKDAKVSSPLAVVGEVPGNWSFEANFPIRLFDSAGKEIAGGPAHVLGDWMTTNLVPFSAQLTYSSSPTGTGMLVLYNDNPSGLTQNADSLSIPIKF